MILLILIPIVIRPVHRPHRIKESISHTCSSYTGKKNMLIKIIKFEQVMGSFNRFPPESVIIKSDLVKGWKF